MSTISHKMFNDSIGNMNKSANYGSSGGSHKRRSKKQIKEDNHRLEYYRQIYQKVMDRLQKLKELKQQVELDTTGKYEKKGIIELPIGELSVGYKPGDTFPLKLTQKKLIDAGYFPEELGWHEKREKASISSKDIAEADKESLLTKAEVGGIKGIISRIKGIFKGKGEK